MKIAHLADLHLGFRQYHRQTPAGINQREADVANAFRAAVDAVIEARPDAIIIAGDLFHAVRPTNFSIVFAFRQLQRLGEGLPGAPVIVIAGNHDTPRSSETGSILRLYEELGVHVASDETRRLVFPELDLSVLAVPHSALFAPERVALRRAGPERHQVLVLHGEVEGVFPFDRSWLEYGGALLDPEMLRAEPWSYVALGHYHVQHEVGPRVWYSGALEYVSPNPWGELADEARHDLPGKGWLLVDLETGTVTRQPVPAARGVYDLRRIDAGGKSADDINRLIADRLAAVPGGLADAIVRLVVENIPRHVVRELDHAAIRIAKGRALYLHLDLRSPETDRLVGVGAPGRRQTLPEMVREYLTRRPLPERLPRERFVSLGMDMLNEPDDEGPGGVALMQIRRLRLRNFRQHADTVLEFETGLTGIVGPNGAGKTTLLEAIAWAIYGTEAARGTKDTIRRRGAPPRARVEVELEFDLGSHRYRIVRSLQQAELFQDGDTTPIANSLAAVTDRVTRLLGMSRDEFFSTYFTGQKELAIMAQMTAPERAQFLSRVLGYEKLRSAQQRLKDHRRVAQAMLEAAKLELIDARRLEAEEEQASARLRAAEEAAARLEAVSREAGAALAALVPVGERWEALQQTVVSLDGDVKVAEHAATSARTQFGTLDRELAEALAAKTRLDDLLPALAPLAALRAERDALDAQREAASGRRSLEARRSEVRKQRERVEERLRQLPPPGEAERTLVELSEVQAALLTTTQEAEARRTAWVREKQDAETQRKNLLAQHEDLREQRRRLESAGAEGVRPTCSRPLGEEYERVMGVLDRQMEEVEFQGKYYRQRIEQLQAEPADVVEIVRDRERLELEAARLTGLAARLAQQGAERAASETERASLATQISQLDASIVAAPEVYDEGRHLELRRQIAVLEPDALLAERLRASAERALDLVSRAATAEQELTLLESRARMLREQLSSLGWSSEGFDAVRGRIREGERAVQQAELGKARAAGELTAALGQRAEVARWREDRERRAAQVQQLQDEVLLHQELDRALGDLRTDLNNTLRPDLSDLASGFLRDLTTGRYTDLELDESYCATVVEEGEAKPVISGGEEDVANLALRLAISQMIAERAGQPLSLLVLDEVFGSLDEERRAAVLDLLRNLADRFPQVILITHIESVRDVFDRVIRLSYDVEARVSRAVPESRDAAA